MPPALMNWSYQRNTLFTARGSYPQKQKSTVKTVL